MTVMCVMCDVCVCVCGICGVARRIHYILLPPLSLYGFHS